MFVFVLVLQQTVFCNRHHYFHGELIVHFVTGVVDRCLVDNDASLEACFDEVVFWLRQVIFVASEIWSCDLFVAVVGYVCVLQMVLAMKCYGKMSILIGFNCLLCQAYRLMIILSFLKTIINFSNDFFCFTMSEFLLCVLNTTDGFDCTYICAIFTTFIDLIPRGIGILKQFESDANVAASNVLHPKRGGVQISAPLTTPQAKNSGFDAPHGGAVGIASLCRTITIRSVVHPPRRELEEFACNSKRDGGFVVG